MLRAAPYFLLVRRCDIVIGVQHTWYSRESTHLFSSPNVNCSHGIGDALGPQTHLDQVAREILLLTSTMLETSLPAAKIKLDHKKFLSSFYSVVDSCLLASAPSAPSVLNESRSSSSSPTPPPPPRRASVHNHPSKHLPVRY